MKPTLKALAATAVAIPLFAAAPPSGKSDLGAQLALLMDDSDEGFGQGEAGAARPARSGWVQRELDGKTGKACAMIYRDGMNKMGYIGPSPGWKESYFFVSGPSVPFTTSPDIIRVAMVTEDDAGGTVKAINYRVDKTTFAILFQLTDFDVALDAMGDRENVAILNMEERRGLASGQSIFSGRWSGGHAAREKLRACLNAQK